VDTYTVQAGDTAFGIALEFDTTVEALAAANNMTEEEITDLQIGQVLQLPRP
jgi:LysM repeat protein